MQADAFAWHIYLAKRSGKPPMIDNRDADAGVLYVLRAEGARETVIFHCFSSGAELARHCVDAGWLVSLSGTLSFATSRAARGRPAGPDRAAAGGDPSPFLTPHRFPGAPNEPYCLPYTVRALAELIDQPAQQLAEITTGNARRVYRLAPQG